jgi:CRP/FNR family transcriptional regulator, cyclic AMP receptor protein
MPGAGEEGRHEAISSDLEYLRRGFLLRGLRDEQLSLFLDLTRMVQMPKGHVLIREGERGESIYIIRRGEVEVSKNLTLPIEAGGNSQQEKALTRLSDRDRAVFGELVLFDEETRSATVRCLNECQFYEFSRDAFLKFAGEHVEIGYLLFKNLAQMISIRLRRSSDDVIKLTTALSIALSR